LNTHHRNNRSAVALFLCLGFLPFADASSGTTHQPSLNSRPQPVASHADFHNLFDDANAWHSAGRLGQGITIAVLDSGFRGYRDRLGRALPSQVTVHSFRRDGDLEAKDSQHGILCAEIIHSLAPAARLLFANWEPNRSDQFLEAVRWARSQGARIISCSLIMPDWGDGEGGGPVHAALARILGSGSIPGDVLFFASAGNIAQRHWSGPFQNDGKGLHQWQPKSIDNELRPWGGQSVHVELSWPGNAHYESLIYDQVSRHILARSSPSPNEAHADVRFMPVAGHRYAVRIHLLEGHATSIHVVVLGAGLALTTRQGGIPFPGDGREAIAVGAVDGLGRRMPYSACGQDAPVPKPDLVAPVPFLTSLRRKPFNGTSATAPQAAAAAALIWSIHPKWSASQVHQLLIESARDIGLPGPDAETGFGVVQLPELDVHAAR
jgi:subtilisin family serine protease